MPGYTIPLLQRFCEIWWRDLRASYPPSSTNNNSLNNWLIYKPPAQCPKLSPETEAGRSEVSIRSRFHIQSYCRLPRRMLSIPKPVPCYALLVYTTSPADKARPAKSCIGMNIVG
jgi:hypothetical protein